MADLDEHSKSLWEEFRLCERKDKAKNLNWDQTSSVFNDKNEKQRKQVTHLDCAILLDCDIKDQMQKYKNKDLPEWYHINFCCECGKLVEALTQEEKEYEKTKGLLHSCCNVTKDLKFEWIKVKKNDSDETHAFSLNFCFHCGSLLNNRTNYE